MYESKMQRVNRNHSSQQRVIREEIIHEKREVSSKQMEIRIGYPVSREGKRPQPVSSSEIDMMSPSSQQSQQVLLQNTMIQERMLSYSDLQQQFNIHSPSSSPGKKITVQQQQQHLQASSEKTQVTIVAQNEDTHVIPSVPHGHTTHTNGLVPRHNQSAGEDRSSRQFQNGRPKNLRRVRLDAVLGSYQESLTNMDFRLKPLPQQEIDYMNGQPHNLPHSREQRPQTQQASYLRKGKKQPFDKAWFTHARKISTTKLYNPGMISDRDSLENITHSPRTDEEGSLSPNYLNRLSKGSKHSKKVDLDSSVEKSVGVIRIYTSQELAMMKLNETSMKTLLTQASKERIHGKQSFGKRMKNKQLAGQLSYTSLHFHTLSLPEALKDSSRMKPPHLLLNQKTVIGRNNIFLKAPVYSVNNQKISRKLPDGYSSLSTKQSGSTIPHLARAYLDKRGELGSAGLKGGSFIRLGTPLKNPDSLLKELYQLHNFPSPPGSPGKDEPEIKSVNNGDLKFVKSRNNWFSIDSTNMKSFGTHKKSVFSPTNSAALPPKPSSPKKNFIELNKDVRIQMNQKKIDRFRKQLKHDKYIWEVMD